MAREGGQRYSPGCGNEIVNQFYLCKAFLGYFHLFYFRVQTSIIQSLRGLLTTKRYIYRERAGERGLKTSVGSDQNLKTFKIFSLITSPLLPVPEVS